VFRLLEAILRLDIKQCIYLHTHIGIHFITFLYINIILFIIECKRDLVNFTASQCIYIHSLMFSLEMASKSGNMSLYILKLMKLC